MGCSNTWIVADLDKNMFTYTAIIQELENRFPQYNEKLPIDGIITFTPCELYKIIQGHNKIREKLDKNQKIKILIPLDGMVNLIKNHNKNNPEKKITIKYRNYSDELN